MLRGWLALVSVYLCLSCLLGVTSPSNPGCSKELYGKVKPFIKIANETSLNCSLYTPSLQDVMQNCPGSSLQCFAAEVKVLFVEWHINNVPGADKFKLNGKLDDVAKKLIKTTAESKCLQCEVFEMKQALTFLEDLQKTIQWMNSQYCT